MKRLIATTIALLLFLVACNRHKEAPAKQEAAATPAAAPAPAPAATPPLDPKNIVSLAIASKDLTTLVTAIKAADYVTPVAASGPLTVFAPTNAAFQKLPAGTVEGLLKPDKVDQLRNILKYHVTTSVWDDTSLKDGTVLGMANGGKATVHVKDGATYINDAKIIASIRGSNGIVHVIDAVLLPPPAAQ